MGLTDVVSSPPAPSAVLVPPVVVAHWPCAPFSVPQARHELRAVLADWGLSDGLADAVELVLSELMTNSFRHTAPNTAEIQVALECDTEGGVRVEVTDDTGTSPELRTAAVDAESGRGLFLVDYLTGGRWGIAPSPAGRKTVWAYIAGGGGVA